MALSMTSLRGLGMRKMRHQGETDGASTSSQVDCARSGGADSLTNSVTGITTVTQSVVSAPAVTSGSWIGRLNPRNHRRLEPDEHVDDPEANVDELTPLMVACRKEQLGIVKKLIKSDRTLVRDVDRHGLTALHHSVNNESTKIAAALLNADLSILNAEDGEGHSALQMAVIANNSSFVKFLLKQGADIGTRDHRHRTLVHWAAQCGLWAMIDLLAAAGAHLSDTDAFGASPLHYVAQMCGAADDDEGQYHVASRRVLERLVVNGAQVDSIDQDLRTPLFWAAGSGSPEACETLLKAGANVQAQDKDGLTALHFAAARGHKSCIEILLKYGAEIDSTDYSGCIALMYSVSMSHVTASRELLTRDSNPNHIDDRGRSPAHWAAAKGAVECLKLLRSRGGDLWKANDRGDYPIHEAALAQQNDAVRYLTTVGGSSRLRNWTDLSGSDGRTCLHIAAMTNNIPLVTYLIDNGADKEVVMAHQDEPLTAFDAAMIKGHYECAEFLKLCGVKSAKPPRPGPSWADVDSSAVRSRSRLPPLLINNDDVDGMTDQCISSAPPMLHSMGLRGLSSLTAMTSTADKDTSQVVEINRPVEDNIAINSPRETEEVSTPAADEASDKTTPEVGENQMIQIETLANEQVKNADSSASDDQLETAADLNKNPEANVLEPNVQATTVVATEVVAPSRDDDVEDEPKAKKVRSATVGVQTCNNLEEAGAGEGIIMTELNSCIQKSNDKYVQTEEAFGTFALTERPLGPDTATDVEVMRYSGESATNYADELLSRAGDAGAVNVKGDGKTVLSLKLLSTTEAKDYVLSPSKATTAGITVEHVSSTGYEDDVTSPQDRRQLRSKSSTSITGSEGPEKISSTSLRSSWDSTDFTGRLGDSSVSALTEAAFSGNLGSASGKDADATMSAYLETVPNWPSQNAMVGGQRPKTGGASSLCSSCSSGGGDGTGNINYERRSRIVVRLRKKCDVISRSAQTLLSSFSAEPRENEKPNATSSVETVKEFAETASGSPATRSDAITCTTTVQSDDGGKTTGRGGQTKRQHWDQQLEYVVFYETSDESDYDDDDDDDDDGRGRSRRRRPDRRRDRPHSVGPTGRRPVPLPHPLESSPYGSLKRAHSVASPRREMRCRLRAFRRSLAAAAVSSWDGWAYSRAMRRHLDRAAERRRRLNEQLGFIGRRGACRHSRYSSLVTDDHMQRHGSRFLDYGYTEREREQMRIYGIRREGTAAELLTHGGVGMGTYQRSLTTSGTSVRTGDLASDSTASLSDERQSVVRWLMSGKNLIQEYVRIYETRRLVTIALQKARTIKMRLRNKPRQVETAYTRRLVSDYNQLITKQENRVSETDYQTINEFRRFLLDELLRVSEEEKYLKRIEKLLHLLPVDELDDSITDYYNRTTLRSANSGNSSGSDVRTLNNRPDSDDVMTTFSRIGGNTTNSAIGLPQIRQACTLPRVSKSKSAYSQQQQPSQQHQPGLGGIGQSNRPISSTTGLTPPQTTKTLPPIYSGSSLTRKPAAVSNSDQLTLLLGDSTAELLSQMSGGGRDTNNFRLPVLQPQQREASMPVIADGTWKRTHTTVVGQSRGRSRERKDQPQRITSHVETYSGVSAL